ncbi:anthranilate synthase component I [Haloarchaeobius sp. HRN-SO-5]|uniref:anthranilate synthase component I n=1 Tax=Haloarchaeobius sp. HRN-SO-5 TaxID=3446118 RepID=UPI003EB8A8F1
MKDGGFGGLVPDRETFVDLVADAATDDRPAVVRAETTLDVDTTPLGAYAALSADAEHAFLLESAGKTASSDPDGAFRPPGDGDRHARYSFVGYDPAAVVRVVGDEAAVEVRDERYEGLVDPDGDDVLDALRTAMPAAEPVGFPDTDRQQLDGGLVGFLAYEAVYDLFLEEVGLDRPETDVPDAEFVLTTKTLVFDHHADEVSLVVTPVVRADEDAGAVHDAHVAETDYVAGVLADADAPDPGGFVRHDESAGPKSEYEQAVERAKEHVLDGDVYQGVVSRTRELVGECDPLGLYAALREVNPSPYMYLLAHGDRHVVGASPETLVSVGGGRVVSNPIAGTCPRGDSPVEDRRLAGEMLADEKERAEHTMLVDLARNDVRRVASPGSVRVEEFMNVLKYSHVQHIESTVTGELGGEYDAFDATRAAFPAGTLTGAPKIRAMEVLDALEPDARGVYGGGVGYYSWTGDADVAIVIRTATVDRHATPDGLDRVTVRAGAGIVSDSVPSAEFEETEAKMDGVLASLRRIERERGEAAPEVSR